MDLEKRIARIERIIVGIDDDIAEMQNDYTAFNVGGRDREGWIEESRRVRDVYEGLLAGLKRRAENA